MPADLTIRSQRVILDADLARLYQKVLPLLSPLREKLKRRIGFNPSNH
jgi:hypothetical protein